MSNEIHIINESYAKHYDNIPFTGYVGEATFQTFIQQDGNIVAQGDDAVCTSTSLSSAIMLKQETK